MSTLPYLGAHMRQVHAWNCTLDSYIDKRAHVCAQKHAQEHAQTMLRSIVE